MRKWKQISAFCLAAALTVSGSAATAWAGSPEFARTPEEWAKLRDNVMDYNELAGLIHEYNVTVQKNQLDINDKKKDDRITGDQYAQYYRDAANDYRDMITGDDPVSDASGVANANRSEALADNNVEDLKVYQLTYDQEEANLVVTAQSSMIAYYQQKYELESTKSSLEFLEAAYQSAIVRQNAGMATQADVLGALESVQSTQASIDKLTSSVEETRQKLCVMLGWKYNDTPDILEIPAVNMERIAAMNPDTDKESALSSNYTLKINMRKLENAVGDVTKQTLNRTIANNEQNIGSDLTKRYRAVLQAKAAYDQAGAELALESKNMDTAQRKYDLGALSKLDYLKQKNAFDTKNLAIKTSELALFQAVQNYDNAVNGLASAGGL
jgi:outer membrane protein TolC